MKLAYLANQYPIPTHSFIRREIRAVESLGNDVIRVSVRPSKIDLPDPADREELGRTTAILGRPLRLLFVDLLAVALARPRSFARVLGRALRLGWRSHAGLGRHLAYFVEACALVRLLRAEGVEHVHAHFGTNATTVAMLTQELGGPPFSFTIHGPGEFDAPELLHLSEKVAAASFVAVITDFAKSQTQRWSEPDHWHKIHVVRCGVDAGFLEVPIEPVGDATRLVCVGRLSKSKAHMLLLEAVRRLVDEGIAVELDLIGDGELRPRIEARIDELGLRAHVRLRGWLGEKEVRESILQSRALVLASSGEGLPVVIMEALALGRPVVATRIAGIPELLEDGESGWLVTPGSADSVATGMRAALEASGETLQRMGEAGRRCVRDRHDVQREGSKLAEHIRSSLQMPEPAP